MVGDLLSITHKQLWVIKTVAVPEKEVWLNTQKTALELINFS
jgi:hypothetical protein